MSHYFVNDDNLKSEEKSYNTSFMNNTFSFVTDYGVFAKEKFDYGTRFLLETFCDKSVIERDILDLGCGYGVVGVILGKLYPESLIDMVDINERAVSLSKENIELNHITNANAWVSNIYNNVFKEYDYILTNPPIKAGKKVVLEFLLSAKNYLKENGELWFVMRKDHGVKSMIKNLENDYIVQILDKSKGFFVVKIKSR